MQGALKLWGELARPGASLLQHTLASALVASALLALALTARKQLNLKRHLTLEQRRAPPPRRRAAVTTATARAHQVFSF